MIRHVLLAALFAAYNGAARAVPRPDKTTASLCEPSETDLFSCDLPAKVVSICGQQHEQAVYRFGRPGHIEIELTNLHFAEIPFSGGGETQVYADKSNYRYLVHYKMVRTRFDRSGHNDPREETGLIVQIDGRIIMHRVCAGLPSFNQHTNTFVPKGEYVAY